MQLHGLGCVIVQVIAEVSDDELLGFSFHSVVKPQHLRLSVAVFDMVRHIELLSIML